MTAVSHCEGKGWGRVRLWWNTSADVLTLHGAEGISLAGQDYRCDYVVGHYVSLES